MLFNLAALMRLGGNVQFLHKSRGLNTVPTVYLQHVKRVPDSCTIFPTVSYSISSVNHIPHSSQSIFPARDYICQQVRGQPPSISQPGLMMSSSGLHPLQAQLQGFHPLPVIHIIESMRAVQDLWPFSITANAPALYGDVSIQEQSGWDNTGARSCCVVLDTLH